MEADLWVGFGTPGYRLPSKGRTGGGLNPPRGVTAARPSFIICGLRQGLEDWRLEEICGHPTPASIYIVGI